MGLVVSHSLGYLAAGTDRHAVDHALGLVHADFAELAGLGASAALILSLVRQLRPDRALPFLSVTFAQCAGFAALETAERASHGVPIGDALREPGLRWGVLLQLLLALTAWLLVRVTQAVVRAFATRRRLRTSRPLRFIPRSLQVLSSISVGAVAGRGPPVLLCHP